MKLARGEPLSEADRQPWLASIREALARIIETKISAVLACSALRRSYRNALIPANAEADDVRFVYLRANRAEIAQRLEARSGHRAAPVLLDSQFAILEEPVSALWLDAGKPPAMLVDSIVSALNLGP